MHCIAQELKGMSCCTTEAIHSGNIVQMGKGKTCRFALLMHHIVEILHIKFKMFIGGLACNKGNFIVHKGNKKTTKMEKQWRTIVMHTKHREKIAQW